MTLAIASSKENAVAIRCKRHASLPDTGFATSLVQKVGSHWRNWRDLCSEHGGNFRVGNINTDNSAGIIV